MSVAAGRRLGLWLLFLPAGLWLGLLVLVPLFDMLLISVQVKVSPRVYRFGFKTYAEFFLEDVYWNTFFRTAIISIAATALTLVAAFPVAYYIAKIARSRSRNLLFVLCLLPFWVSELVRTFGWMILLRETGVISGFLRWVGVADAPIELLYNDAAIVIGLVYTSILFMIVPLVTVLDSLDDNIIEAAYDLGGSGPAILREIVVPHAMPEIVGGTIIVFMLTLGNYLTSTLLGGKNSLWFTEQIYNQFITRFNWEQGSAFGFLLLALSSLIIWLGLRLTGQSLAKTLAERAPMLATLNRSRAARAATGLYVAAFFAYLFAPLLTVAVFSFNDSTFPSPPWKGFTIDWYVSADGARLGLWHDARLLESVYVSLKVALAVALLSVAVGTCNAFLLARQDIRFRETLYMMMLWPLVVPGVILGIAILVFTNGVANRLDGWLGWEAEWLRPGTMLVILGQFSFIATVATLVISARLKKFNPTLEEAALSLGASRIVAVATVTLPFLKPAMIGAGIVAFLMSFENFNTTLMLVGSDATLPVAMYARLRQGSTPVLNAISVMLILASAFLAVAMILLAREDDGSGRS